MGTSLSASQPLTRNLTYTESAMFASIRTRILATCVAIVVTALAVTGGLVYYVVKKDNEQTIGENLKSISTGNATAIEEWVSGKARIAQALASTRGEIMNDGWPLRMRTRDSAPASSQRAL